MKKLFTKNQILTIPNLLSLFRLLLIPLILYVYCAKEMYYLTIILIVISGLTDVIDGFIARHFNQVSDLGKVIDPVADKLTQGALIICLSFRYKLMILLIVVFAIKEIIMSIMGLIFFKNNNKVSSSKWHGKVATVFLYVSLSVLILFPNLPLFVVNTIIICASLLIINSLILYAIFYIKNLKQTIKTHLNQASKWCLVFLL